MIELAILGISRDRELKFEINEELIEFFNDEDEMYGYIDGEKLQEALLPFANELVKRVNELAKTYEEE